MEDSSGGKGAGISPNQVELGGVIFHHDDLHRVVERFYGLVAQDPLLEVPFRSVHDWDDHIKRLTHFWWAKFGGRPYLFNDYNPVPKHFFAGFNEELLRRWLELFSGVLRDELRPDQAQLWGRISEQMGRALTMKNEMFREAYERSRRGAEGESE